MKRMFQRPSRIWVVSSVALVAALALLPGSWQVAVAQTGSPAPTATATFTATPTATSTTLPTTGGTVTVPNAGLTLNFGQGALGANTKVDFTPLVSVPPLSPTATALTQGQQTLTAQQTNTAAVNALAAQNVPPPPVVASGGGVIQSLFQLDATNTTSNSRVTVFNAPVTLAIVVPPGTLSLAGGNLANVQVFRFSETTRTWVQVSCTTGAGGLNCSTPGFSLWALVVATQLAAGPAQQAPAGPRPANTGTGVADDSNSLVPMLALVLAAGSLVGVGAYAMRRRRS